MVSIGWEGEEQWEGAQEISGRVEEKGNPVWWV